MLLRELLANHKIDPHYLLHYMETTIESKKELLELMKEITNRADYLKEEIAINTAEHLRQVLRQSLNDGSDSR